MPGTMPGWLMIKGIRALIVINPEIIKKELL